MGVHSLPHMRQILQLLEPRDRRVNGLVNYTSPQSFLFCWLNIFEDFYCILIGWFKKLSVRIAEKLHRIKNSFSSMVNEILTDRQKKTLLLYMIGGSFLLI